MSSGNPETRMKILGAAWKLLESPNPKGARMSDIAKLAGVSRQALYLHFPTRTELLIATTHYIDAVKDVDGRLEKSRKARSGTARLDAFIEAWGNYIPEISGVARALMAMSANDPDAKAAWNDRMQAVRHGCAAAVSALEDDDSLTRQYSRSEATDILWTMLSLENWIHFRENCNWSQRKYLDRMTSMARRLLLRGDD